MKTLLAICFVAILPLATYGQQLAVRPYPVIPDSIQADRQPIRPMPSDGPQIVLKIQIFEVSLTKLQQMGQSLEKLTGVTDSQETLQALEALRLNNVLTVLAQPTLVTFNGRPVTFHSDDEFPVPKPQPDGSVLWERRHSIELECTPEVQDEQVRTEFLCRLSKLHPDHPVKVGNKTLPGVEVIECRTGAELKAGQMLTLIGPTYERTEALVKCLPVVSEIPYVGAVFKKAIAIHNELTTVILVQSEIKSE